jgi:ADP-ribosyl-[dinitrogen reductase] hydrolase
MEGDEMTYEDQNAEAATVQIGLLPNDVLRRARGCLIGQLAGDALGSMVEFASGSTLRQRYPDGLRVIGPSPVHNTLAGQPTDDSELALALARSLVARGGFDVEAVANAYADWLASGPFDVGNAIGQAVSAMCEARAHGKPLAEAGQAGAQHGSEANGALMRQSPLAIWGWRLEDSALADLVVSDTLLTHPSQVCQDASAAFVVALAAVIRGGVDAQATYAVALAWDRTHGKSAVISDALTAAAYTPPRFGPNVGHVPIALQNAFYQALHAASFEEGVIASVMGGGDTDTNAAIAGALLGALHGLDAVPEQWRESVLGCRPSAENDAIHPRPEHYWPVDALDLAERLLRGATYPPPERHWPVDPRS